MPPWLPGRPHPPKTELVASISSPKRCESKYDLPVSEGIAFPVHVVDSQVCTLQGILICCTREGVCRPSAY